MARYPNTTRDGYRFSDQTVNAVWAKGRVIPGYDPAQYRLDACNAVIARTHYGSTASQYGWEVDHIRPVASGGSDDLSNLQPLQWENNRHKSDHWPQWTCKVAAA